MTDSQTALEDVRFVVVDIETTGSSPSTCEITELAAVIVQGGHVVASFETFVSITSPLPHYISQLTGIYEPMLVGAPSIESVMARFIDFARGAVVVGHNVRFDLSFIKSELTRWHPKETLDFTSVDTLPLARKLLNGEVSNFKLATLAREMQLDHIPTHRAMHDVLATVDLLYLLIDRASRFGVRHLDELLELPNKLHQLNHPKMKIANFIPRIMGVYWMSDFGGSVIYVGKSNDLNARFRSYFTSDSRRKTAKLLDAMWTFCYFPCSSELQALILEQRLIGVLRPRFNRNGKIDLYQYCFIQSDVPTHKTRNRIQRVRDNIESNPLEGNMIGPFRSMKTARLANFALGKALDFNKDINARESWNTTFEEIQVHDKGSIGLQIPLKILSNNLFKMISLLASAQLFEEAEKLRVGSQYLMIGMNREYVRRLFSSNSNLEFISRMTGTQISVKDGNVELNLAEGMAIGLNFNHQTHSKKINIHDLISENEQTNHPSDELQFVANFEEWWIIWSILINSLDWQIKHSTVNPSMSLDFAHRSFLPKEITSASTEPTDLKELC